MPGYADDHPWELKRNEQGIRVYTRKVDGSPIFEFKAVMTVDENIGKVVALYENVDGLTRWFHRSIEASLVKRVSPDEMYIYFAADLPWPCSDRDGIYRQMKSVDEDSVIYDINSAPDNYPPNKNRARVLYLDAEWRFRPLPDGRTEVNYRTHTAPGGYIPPAMVNRFVVSLPFKTFVKFRNQLKAGNGI